MPSVETKIWLALKSRIDSLMPGVTKAYPAEIFEVPKVGLLLSKYIRVGHVSAEPASVFIETGTPHQRSGALIVSLVHPIRIGYTLAQMEEIAGQIAQHFSDGTTMRYLDVCVSVNASPHVQGGYEDSGMWTIPVTINWTTFA